VIAPASTYSYLLTISNINFWKAVKNNEIDDKKIKIKVGDYVRIQTKKTNLSKGYTSNYSKNVYIVVELFNDGKVLLDDDKIVMKKDLLVVPEGSVNIDDTNKERADKLAKLKRKLLYF
jgi:hypothetical protein